MVCSLEQGLLRGVLLWQLPAIVLQYPDPCKLSSSAVPRVICLRT